MLSIFNSKSVVLAAAPLVTLALALCAGCDLESESVELDDEEVGQSEAAISGTIDPAAAKAACEAKGRVWKSGACTEKCMNPQFKLYAGKCYDGLSVDTWIRYDNYAVYCEQTLHGAWNPNAFYKCQTPFTCSKPPGALADWTCASTAGGTSLSSSSNTPDTSGMDISWCVGLGCGTETKTIDSTQFQSDHRCVESDFCI